ncbi:hypothetical protein J1N35_017748 [Gossypium stocksii]|uniref:Uncharacterized protein n=1 Tax=Gossypium stocksii TaxID=47602 RepID=A0A9D4A6I1_9ROSI|nr:hypothetical protein J1N35_017748 [Gossypium stocksii]
MGHLKPPKKQPQSSYLLQQQNQRERGVFSFGFSLTHAADPPYTRQRQRSTTLTPGVVATISEAYGVTKWDCW